MADIEDEFFQIDLALEKKKVQKDLDAEIKVSIKTPVIFRTS